MMRSQAPSLPLAQTSGLQGPGHCGVCQAEARGAHRSARAPEVGAADSGKKDSPPSPSTCTLVSGRQAVPLGAQVAEPSPIF